MIAFVFSLLLCSAIGAWVDQCSLKFHFKCANDISKITDHDVCPSLKKADECAKSLMSRCKLQSCAGNETKPTDCAYDAKSEYTRNTSMVGKDPVCQISKRLDYCYKKDCEKDSEKIESVGTENTCLKNAVTKCLRDVEFFGDTVDGYTCRMVSRANSCYLKELKACIADVMSYRAVDVRADGLDRHLKMCQSKGYELNDGVCTMEEYTKCFESMSKIKLSNVCSQLNDSVLCLKDLRDKCSFTDCPGQPVASCNWDNSVISFTPPTFYKLSPCRAYSMLEQCRQSHCVKKQKTFSKVVGFEDDQCVENAVEKCLDYVKDIQNVSEKSCREIAEAKGCLLNEFLSCTRTNELNQNMVYVLLSGMFDHIQQCNIAGFRMLAPEGKQCVPNPLDALVYDRKVMSPDFNLYSYLDEEECSKISETFKELTDYMDKCYPNRYIGKNIKKILKNMARPFSFCKENFPQFGNAAYKGHPSEILSIMAVISVLVLYYSFQLSYE